ncbi:hypothetical protein ACLOJK_040413, partial [Asimina triloba]
MQLWWWIGRIWVVDLDGRGGALLPWSHLLLPAVGSLAGSGVMGAAPSWSETRMGGGDAEGGL